MRCKVENLISSFEGKILWEDFSTTMDWLSFKVKQNMIESSFKSLMTMSTSFSLVVTVTWSVTSCLTSTSTTTSRSVWYQVYPIDFCNKKIRWNLRFTSRFWEGRHTFGTSGATPRSSGTNVVSLWMFWLIHFSSFSTNDVVTGTESLIVFSSFSILLTSRESFSSLAIFSSQK